MYTFDINFNFMSDSLVIIPTYNEKENIENIIRAVFGLSKPFDILVIDDGSPDGTAAIVHRLAETEFSDRLFIEERTGKLGSRDSLYSRLQMGPSPYIRLYFRDGCRFFPQSRRPAQTLCRMSR